MKTTVQMLLAGALSALAATATAEQPLRSETLPLGAVEAVYVKIAPGLFIETRLLRTRKTAETWSDVRVRHFDAGKPRNELAKNPEGMAVQPGDVVQLTIATAPEFAASPMPEITRITARVALAGSAVARRFQQQITPAVTIAEQLRM